MKVAVFSAKNYDREFLRSANASRHELHFFEPQLSEQTTTLAEGFDAVCVFVNDTVNALVVAKLTDLGVRLIALRIFFEDRSGLIIPDDLFARLLTFPNVIITGHQAFFTREALGNIAATTIDNITKFQRGQRLETQVPG
jgi:lactate dehydrogenase-like 2-hydroxyacid dehydrogenase